VASCLQIRSLLQAYIDGELGSGEKLLFEEHLRSCEACRDELENARALAVRLFEVLRRDRLLEDISLSVMAHLPEMEFTGPLSFLKKRRTSGLTRKKADSWAGRAAKLVPVYVPIILLVLGGLLWSNWPANNGMENSTVGMVIFSKGNVESEDIMSHGFAKVANKDILSNGDLLKTGPGARLLFGLTGPSHATLYENSSLQVVNERELVLEKGSIFLDVHRESRNFQVSTPHGIITVLGTSFHVNTGPSGTEVTVVSGEVLVENEKSFALLTQGKQAVFQDMETPVIYENVQAARYLEEARSVLPDPVAERIFMSKFVSPVKETVPPKRQVFMVETKRRPVSAIVLNWVPDPYIEGHAGYTVYVSDSSLNPLFKNYISPDVFGDKNRSSIRIAMPPELQEQAVATLHITLAPDYGSGSLATSFTEVSAIGIRQ
jgi:hypothetical protein